MPLACRWLRICQSATCQRHVPTLPILTRFHIVPHTSLIHQKTKKKLKQRIYTQFYKY